MSAESSNSYQSQVQATELATQVLNLQETMKGVVRTLERLERVVEGVDRPGALSRHRLGDANHHDINTNLEALNARLGCLQGILGAYQIDSYRSQCVNHLNQWYQKRQGRYSPVLAQAAFESISACVGEFTMKTVDVKLSEYELMECARRLYEACSRYHEKADKVSADPQDYLNSDHCMKVFTDGRMQDTDWNDLLEAMRLENQAQEDEGDNIPDVKGEGEHHIPYQSETWKADSAYQGENQEREQLAIAASGSDLSAQSVPSGVYDEGASISNVQTAPSQLAEYFVSWLIWLFEQNAEIRIADLFQKVQYEILQFHTHLDTHPTERGGCAIALKDWYLKSKTTVSKDVLLCIAFSIVAFLGKPPEKIDRMYLQEMLSDLYYVHKDQSSISDICRAFYWKLEEPAYSNHH